MKLRTFLLVHAIGLSFAVGIAYAVGEQLTNPKFRGTVDFSDATNKSAIIDTLGAVSSSSLNVALANYVGTSAIGVTVQAFDAELSTLAAAPSSTATRLRDAADFGSLLLSGTSAASVRDLTETLGTAAIGVTVHPFTATTGTGSIAHNIAPAFTGISVSGTAAVDVLVAAGRPRFNGTNTTGSNLPAFTTNCPAANATNPYTWIQITTADGSTAYFPVWK